MGVQYNMTGVPQETLQGRRLQTALSMSIPQLVRISNGAGTVNGVDSLTAVMALQIKGPAEKAARAQQAGQQPPQQTVKDQVIAQAAPEDVGIAALPQTDSVMTDNAMAAGGIVAFDEGGLTQDITAQLAELRRRRSVLAAETGRVSPTVSARGVPAVNAGLGSNQANVEKTRQLRELDTQIAQLENKFKTAQGREQTYLAERAAEMAPSFGFQAPAGLGQEQQAQQQRQQPPGAGGAGATGGYPGVSSALSKLRQAYGSYETFDPMQGLIQFEAGPYERFLPKTAEDIRAQRDEAEAELRKMYPESREAAEELMAKRYAGLEKMFAAREARAEEAKAEATTEKGRTAGLGLMQLASELITKPLQRIDTSAAFQTFKEANKDYRQAQKDFRDSKDKIDEARELQKIGQFEKADALFREGARGIFDFKNQTAQLENAQDTAYKSGLLNLAGKNAQAQADKLAKRVELGKIEVDAALGIEKLRSEERQAGMYANARGLSGRFSLEDKAQDNAKAALDQYLKENPLIATQTLKDPELIRRLQNRFYLEELAKLQGQTAAPSGGGAGFDPSQWGEPKLKTR